MTRHPSGHRGTRRRRGSSTLAIPLAAALAATALTAVPAAATTSTPAVANPGFEANGTGVASPSGWSSSGTTTADYTESGGHAGSYRLSHWSSSAYTVDTYQTITNITNGYYTLGVWVRSDDTGGSNYISLSGCGNATKTTYVPVDSDGNWLHIVDYVYVSDNQCTINLYSRSAANAWTNYDDITFTAGAAPVSIRGGDTSSLYRGEQLGGAYYNSSGTQQNALQILKNGGMDYVRLRVWVNPQDGMNNEATLLASAKQAYGYGLPILLDLHYSDTWADPGHQSTPAAWSADTLSQLEGQVYAYSKQVVGDLVAQGTPPAMVQVGNEINAGMLWPDGSTSNWPQLAALLRQGVAGVKAAYAPTKIVLHLAASDSLSTLESWYSTALNYGVSFDVIGISYYDYWHGRLDVLQSDLNGLAAKYGKPVMVAETAYPWTMANDDSQTNSVTSSNTTLDPGYAASAAGQAANLRDVLSIVQAVPNGLGLGAFYWEPTWTVVAGNGWDPANPGSGDGWENQAAFDFNDRALPVVSQFAAR
ncbi:glycosyl hydrolase 53 family protein [Actinocrinis puniceicyclus]|uniref:Arabinogalactan endo-beta-1,4-galactanase n=1 Tax=Actinocrinis puniceicyclus TaxID=977794 RepID=A0A8J7WMX7_9ACTN|nr:glycosyl hydrolase 53 family protein [Actinocrinis puniceicyclus]MBS2965308.1 glycosyl hydrolase 53 family protein [Actinocrinis puniceicyclus]